MLCVVVHATAPQTTLRCCLFINEHMPVHMCLTHILFASPCALAAQASMTSGGTAPARRETSRSLSSSSSSKKTSCRLTTYSTPCTCCRWSHPRLLVLKTATTSSSSGSASSNGSASGSAQARRVKLVVAPGVSSSSSMNESRGSLGVRH